MTEGYVSGGTDKERSVVVVCEGKVMGQGRISVANSPHAAGALSECDTHQKISLVAWGKQSTGGVGPQHPAEFERVVRVRSVGSKKHGEKGEVWFLLTLVADKVQRSSEQLVIRDVGAEAASAERVKRRLLLRGRRG